MWEANYKRYYYERQLIMRKCKYKIYIKDIQDRYKFKVFMRSGADIPKAITDDIDNLKNSNNVILGNINDLNNKVIYDTGSNQYGNWIRYTDGTMIITRDNIIRSINIDKPWGPLFVGVTNETFNYSQNFIKVPFIMTKVLINGDTAILECQYVKQVVGLKSFSGISLARPTLIYNAPIKISFIAIGKWK